MEKEDVAPEKILEMETAVAADYSNIAGMVVLKNGKAVYENYFGGCTEESRIHVFSVTKSIVSLLIGIALDKGCLDSIDQKVLEFYPGYTVKRGEKTIQHITIRDMLTMTASPMDMAKIGELIRGGVYNGRRIVSEKWVRESTSGHSWWTEQDLPYGYLWWVLEQEHGCAAVGDGGNIIYVDPDRDMVVAIASRFKPAAKDRIGSIRKYVVPVFGGSGVALAEG